MAKGIDREKIQSVTLDLLKNQENIRNVNLREIARQLGCAHTNLYNYYNDLDQIFWEALDVILERMETFLTADLSDLPDGNTKIYRFYTRFIEFYLENPGWFRLVWLEKLEAPRPQKNINLTNQTVAVFCELLADYFKEEYSIELSHAEAKYILHGVHCYLHGEVSIFISGRGLIKDTDAFKQHVVETCVHLSALLATALKNGEVETLHPAFSD